MANASANTKKIVKKKKTVKTIRTKQTAFIFRFLKYIMRFVQILFGFYAFFNVVFWFLYITKFVNKESIYYILFQPAWDIVNIFYTYKYVQDNEEIDFTGVVCAICLTIIASILNSLYEYFAELEEKAKIEDAKRLEKAKKRAIVMIKNKSAIKNKNAGFVFLLDINIKQVSGFIQEDALSPEEIAKLRNNFFTSILNNLNLNQVSQKGYYRKKLFLVYKHINYFDDFIFYAKETLNSLSKEFARPTLRIDFLVGMNIISENEDLKEKLDVIDTINKLNLKNEFICTQALKELYEFSQKQNYKMTSKGVYNLSKNLNVSNNQEIFSLREGQ